MKRILTIGLTGGLASGKSTAARLFAARGARICDADQVVAELYSAGRAGAKAVVELFGSSVLADDGSIDRARLGALVFNDPEALQKLNRAIHPLVGLEISRWLDGLDDLDIAVVEATLMVETGSYKNYDLLVVVWCEAAQQLERAINRGLSPDRAQKILNAQLDLQLKIDLADYVIDNSQDRPGLAVEVDRVWRKIRDHRSSW